MVNFIHGTQKRRASVLVKDNSEVMYARNLTQNVVYTSGSNK